MSDLREKKIAGEAGRQIYIYTPADVSGADMIPAVYLNEFEGDGKDVYRSCLELGAKPFSLVVVSGIDWNRDMTPWPAPAVFKGEDYSGGADGYLEWMTGTLVPEAEDAVEEMTGAGTSERMLAGYSLAGLFSLYAAYRTDAFDRFASCSGSLWYEGFVDFAESTGFAGRNASAGGPRAVYLSLGDKEKKARNRLMRTVEDCTRRLYDDYVSLGIDCVFELNPGGHFKDPELRTAKGICWMLSC